MRAMLKVNRLTPTSWMLDTLKWLNVRERLQVNTIIFYSKNEDVRCTRLCNRTTTLRWEVQPYSLRNVMDFRIQQGNTSANQKSLFYKGLTLYNMLPFNVKNACV